MLVVADSSPLIYLSRVGLLHVLAALFGEVVVPQIVWNEVVERRPSAPGIDALREAADLLLIDERVGRKVAHERGLAVRGTLGVLVQAGQSGVLAALKPALDALVAEGFRIAPALTREALAHLGEGPDPAEIKSTDRS